MTLPEDNEKGVGGMIEDFKPDAYEDLPTLSNRGGTEVKVNAPAGADEATMALKYGYSMPINQISRVTLKSFGYMENGNVTDPLEQAAVKGSNAIHSLFFDAPCVNRQGRYDEEEQRAKTWEGQIREAAADRDPNAPDLTKLLNDWSKADSFMLQARVYEEHNGIENSRHLYEEYTVYQKLRDSAEFEASRLPSAENMFFWCRVRQYRIMRERAYDLAMGYPIADFTEVKKAMKDGDINDMVHLMPWPYQEGYLHVMASKLDGEAYRTMVMALVAGQLPAPQMPYPPPGMMPPWGYPGYGGDMDGDGDGDGPPDKRPAMFNLFGRKKNNQNNGDQPQNQKPPNRRRRNRQSTQR